jgi:uncharacterized protein
MNTIIPPQSGTAFHLKKGQRLKIIDPQGQQVSDMVLFNAEDPREKISSGKTLDFEECIQITKGNFLWSNRSNHLAYIEEDTNGRNDFLVAPCCKKTFEIMYEHEGYHSSCKENLENALASYDIQPDDIPTAFNVFMNVQYDAQGNLSVLPPTSKAGDHLVIRAEIDLLVGLTACSAEDSNGGSFKPIAFEIID